MRFAALASVSLLLGCASHGPARAPASASTDEWTAYGKDVLGSRNSGLTQIDTSNVARLQVAWTYHTGEVGPQAQTRNPRRSLEATPIVVDGVMYLLTPLGRVIALDPETGRERWVYDARIDRTIAFGDHTSRGVSAWLEPSRAPGQPCRLRIVAAIVDARLLSIDAATGRLCEDFGDRGTVDLRVGPCRTGGRAPARARGTRGRAARSGAASRGNGIAADAGVRCAGAGCAGAGCGMRDAQRPTRQLLPQRISRGARGAQREDRERSLARDRLDADPKVLLLGLWMERSAASTQIARP